MDEKCVRNTISRECAKNVPGLEIREEGMVDEKEKEHIISRDEEEEEMETEKKPAMLREETEKPN